MPVNDANIEIMFTLTRFYDKVKTARERSKLKKIIVSNIKEALPPFTRLLFTLLKEKKEGHHLDALAEGDVWMKDLLAETREFTQNPMWKYLLMTPRYSNIQAGQQVFPKAQLPCIAMWSRTHCKSNMDAVDLKQAKKCT